MSQTHESRSRNAEPELGRRERNKADKLQRITEAAMALFAERSVTEVTTSEIAKRAEVAEGTLFLYAATKGELLLLAQNASYREANAKGLAESRAQADAVGAVLALVRPIIECNRHHVTNGRAYLQEVMFGVSESETRREALELMTSTEKSIAEALKRTARFEPARASQIAKLIQAAVFVALGSPLNVSSATNRVVDDVTDSVRHLLAGIEAKSSAR